MTSYKPLNVIGLAGRLRYAKRLKNSDFYRKYKKKEGDSTVSFLNVNPQTHNMG